MLNLCPTINPFLSVPCKGERERERERESEKRKRDRDKDKDKYRNSDRDTKRQRDCETERQKETGRDRERCLWLTQSTETAERGCTCTPYLKNIPFFARVQKNLSANVTSLKPRSRESAPWHRVGGKNEPVIYEYLGS